ncbi:odorant receptor 131-2-like [Mugil cephalus]|uniref:odorant receptor 131-2-like n=1 Tax=Mugil cephalus TaxID=48193 RepID=UPI001FB7B8CF|nr:odorant receptor 131-2-like [Mugil cephalus]
MLNTSQINVSAELQYQGLVTRIMTGTLTSVPCCVFLFINGTMLFILRSKCVFRDTCRFILLYNLLFADTVHMALGQLLYIISLFRIFVTYPACGFLTMLTSLTAVISPLTLVVMSLERYVAVCYPLRHATIITVRNTGVTIVLVWVFCLLNILIRVGLLLEFPFEELESLQMTDFCSDIAMFLGSTSADYDKGFSFFVFVSAALVIVSSYVGVIVAARSASTDKASARKARNTLIMHMVQLGLNLSSKIFYPLFILFSKALTRIVFVRIYNVFYVCFIMFPRCLSTLIYGIRDQTIRPIVMYYFCCRMKVSVTSTQAEK